MCGIVAYLGKNDAIPVALDGLKRLEYRGYDSWGIAWVDSGSIRLVRKIGRVGTATMLPSAKSDIAIAHTRWATHGGVEERNAHPHLSNDRRLAVVHNGIIENYAELRAFLRKNRYRFSSDTDTEVIPNLLQYYMDRIGEFPKAFSATLARLQGTFAIVVLNSPDHSLAFARKGSPLCIGIAPEGHFAASDVSAFLTSTKDVIYLNDDEYGFISDKGLVIKRLGSSAPLRPEPLHLKWDAQMAEKNGFPHFMLKEIMEQPRIIEETLTGRLSVPGIRFDELKIPNSTLRALSSVRIISCGTAYYASIISKYMIEELSGLDVETDYASEFRYRKNLLAKNTLFIFISQSGETADTLAAMRRAKASGAKTLSIVNVIGSTLARESDYVIYTRAGPEIGVASTKAFISQLTTMLLFGAVIGASRKKLSPKDMARLSRQLALLPKQAASVLKANTAVVKAAARRYAKSKSMLYIGRNINYPIALEGALKLKEISYMHAEGFPAGELKHGPIALIDPAVPTVCVAVNSETYPKLISNIQEIKARKGPIIAVATQQNMEIRRMADAVFYVPPVPELLSPILAVLPLQLFAYFVALERGCDIDKPRNLAKSVTVE